MAKDKVRFPPKKTLHEQFIPPIEDQHERERRFGSGKGFAVDSVPGDHYTVLLMPHELVPKVNPAGGPLWHDGPAVDNTRGQQIPLKRKPRKGS
jgi:hypothetical protein